jgi:preprotein translocase subunit SecE
MSDYWPMMLLIGFALVAITIAIRQGYFLRLSGYWNETMEELKKCTWPTWDELTGSTVVVIVSVALLGGFTVIVDFMLASLIKLIV